MRQASVLFKFNEASLNDIEILRGKLVLMTLKFSEANRNEMQGNGNQGKQDNTWLIKICQACWKYTWFIRTSPCFNICWWIHQVVVVDCDVIVWLHDCMTADILDHVRQVRQRLDDASCVEEEEAPDLKASTQIIFWHQQSLITRPAWKQNPWIQFWSNQ